MIHRTDSGDQVRSENLGDIMSEFLSGSMEKTIRVPKKRRSSGVWSPPVGPSSPGLDEGHKKAKVVPEIQEEQGSTKGEYHEKIKAKWSRLSKKIIVQLGIEEMAAFCQELEVVGSSEELSSVIHSEGTNAKPTTVAEISSLQVRIEELHARNKLRRAQPAKTTELELESAVQKSVAEKEALEKIVAHLEGENYKQSKMIEFYGTRIEELKTKIGELEDCLDATSSKSLRADKSPDELLQNTKLRQEVNLLQAQLEVALVQTDMEIQKKEEAITELLELQNLRAIYYGTKDELTELRRLKSTFEAEKDELATLRCQKQTFEAAESELKAVYSRMPYQRSLLKVAAEELQTLRRQKETYQTSSEELCRLRELKATYEAVTEDIATLRATSEYAAEELAALRKQKFVFETAAEELEELRKQKEMSNSERDELELLRSQRAAAEAANWKSVNFQGRENARTAKERSLMAKVERLIQKQTKLVNTIRYFEGKVIVDKQENEWYSSELEAARTKIRILHEEKKDLSEKETLRAKNNRLLKEKQNLELLLLDAKEENTNLRFQVELKEEARVAFCKEIKIECLKAELRSKEEEAEAAFEEIESLKRANAAKTCKEIKLKEELHRASKELDGAVSKGICRICLENPRDTVLLPCNHMQSCVRCVKELIQKDKSCPACSKMVTGFVPCNLAL